MNEKAEHKGKDNIRFHVSAVKGAIKHIKKDWGIFFTPQWLVDFMVDMIDERKYKNNVKILEPACGLCQFLEGIKRKKRRLFMKSSLRGVEINEEVIAYIRRNALNDRYEIVHADYLLWETDERFDIIIGNPPYGIPSLSEHYTIKVDNETKKKYKEIYETWYGKYNVYGAFIEKSVKLLKEEGQLIFIVPATFMILDEFKKLREFLAKNGRTEIIYMGKVFTDANVATVILNFSRSEEQKNHLILREYDERHNKLKLISENRKWRGEVVLFATEFSKKVDEICSFRLGDVYTVRISPRTPEIKRNPDVIKAKGKPPTTNEDMLPVLNSRNLKIGEVSYRPITGYWIAREKKNLRAFFAKPHIVVGLGFRGNGQIAAAYDHKAYPWMGDVYHLMRKSTLYDMTDEEVIAYLNSEIVRRYVKDVFRDITYHLSITQLKMLPLPTREELEELLKELKNLEREKRQLEKDCWREAIRHERRFR